MLTHEDMAILKRPFAPQHHEFLKGNAYITEMAITERIEQVDPSWTLEQITLYKRDGLSMQAVCTMRLTIKGVSRDGVGMSAIVPTKVKESKEGKSEVGEANEAEKSAATDALKRAARLFGIGRYLLDLPANVVDERSLAQHLAKIKPATTPPAPPAPQVDVSTGEIMDAPAPVPPQPQPASAVVTPTPAKPESRAGDLHGEALDITRIELEKDTGETLWRGIGEIEDPKMTGLKHKVYVKLWKEDMKVLKEAGYDVSINKPVLIPVILDCSDRNMIRINHAAIEPYQPRVNPYTGAQTAANGVSAPQATETAQKPTSKEPDWFQKTLKEQFGLFKTYAQEHIYGTNLYHMKGSLKKHGVVDAKDKLTPAWENKTIGEAVKLLNDLRQHEQVEKAS